MIEQYGKHFISNSFTRPGIGKPRDIYWPMGDDLSNSCSGVLRLRGLPFNATPQQILQFFEGYDVKNCILCTRNDKPTGEAFVQLDSEASAHEALQKLNCNYMGHRYIEIFEASESDLAHSAGKGNRGEMGFVLRLRGLPYSSTRSDLELFFEGLDIVKGEEGVVFAFNSNGRPTGEAYVEFANEKSQEEAMKKQKHYIGSRYIELFKSTKADLCQALHQNRFYREQNRKRLLARHNHTNVSPISSMIQTSAGSTRGLEARGLPVGAQVFPLGTYPRMRPAIGQFPIQPMTYFLPEQEFRVNAAQVVMPYPSPPEWIRARRSNDLISQRFSNDIAACPSGPMPYEVVSRLPKITPEGSFYFSHKNIG